MMTAYVSDNDPDDKEIVVVYSQRWAGDVLWECAKEVVWEKGETTWHEVGTTNKVLESILLGLIRPRPMHEDPD